jgi:hypothetical protein
MFKRLVWLEKVREQMHGISAEQRTWRNRQYPLLIVERSCISSARVRQPKNEPPPCRRARARELVSDAPANEF